MFGITRKETQMGFSLCGISLRGISLRGIIVLAIAVLNGAIPYVVAAEETLPPLKDGTVPETIDEIWAGFDPQREPLETEILKEWEVDGLVCRIVRYRIGIFKGTKSLM